MSYLLYGPTPPLPSTPPQNKAATSEEKVFNLFLCFCDLAQISEVFAVYCTCRCLVDPDPEQSFQDLFGQKIKIFFIISRQKRRLRKAQTFCCSLLCTHNICHILFHLVWGSDPDSDPDWDLDLKWTRRLDPDTDLENFWGSETESKRKWLLYIAKFLL